MQKRIHFLDVVKALAIFFVIWGHLLQYLDKDYSFVENPVFTFIYSFHMPLFFMISGIFFKSSLKLDFKTFSKKKSIQLLLPCFVWSIFFYFIANFKGVISEIESLHFIRLAKNFLTHAEYPFWFLQEVFKSYFILFLLFKVIKKEWVVYLSAIILVMFLPYSENQRFLFPFFITGIYLKEIIAEQRFPKKMLLLSAILFVICLAFWKTKYTIYYTPFPSFLHINSENFHLIYIAFYRFIIGLLGSITVVFGVKYFMQNLTVPKWIIKIGNHTQEIYILQTVLMDIYIMNHLSIKNGGGYAVLFTFGITPIIAFLMLAITFFTAQLISRNKTLDLILLGKNNK